MKIKPRDFTILLILVGLLFALQAYSDVLSGVRWDIPGISDNPYKLNNNCYADILFETVDGEEWLRTNHDVNRRFTPDQDFQVRRPDNEQMRVDVNGEAMVGRTIAIQLDNYQDDVTITTCADE